MEIGRLLQRRALFFQRAFVKHLPDTTDLNPSPARFFFGRGGVLSLNICLQFILVFLNRHSHL